MAYTYQYSQPDEYHFSLDSIVMPELVSKRLVANRQDLDSISVLDLCSGCGVLGFELSWHLQKITKIDFVEVQKIYEPYFKKNIEIINRPEVKFQLHLKNYENLLTKDWEKSFDVIVCNPPYFLPGQGKVSPSEFKNRCRFFMDSSFEKLIEVILHTLKIKGEAYVLLRPLTEHGRNLRNKLDQILSNRAQAEFIADVRGTDLLLIRHKVDSK